jgi:hypothetical protein
VSIKSTNKWYECILEIVSKQMSYDVDFEVTEQINKDSIMNLNEFQLSVIKAGTPIYLTRQQNNFSIRAGETWEDHWLYLAYDLEIGTYKEVIGKVTSPYRFIPKGTRFQGIWRASSNNLILTINKIFLNGSQDINAVSEHIGHIHYNSRVSMHERRKYGVNEIVYFSVDPREIIVYLEEDFVPWPEIPETTHTSDLTEETL